MRYNIGKHTDIRNQNIDRKGRQKAKKNVFAMKVVSKVTN